MKTEKKVPRRLTHVYEEFTFNIYENTDGGITICDYLTWDQYGVIPDIKIPALPIETGQSSTVVDKEFELFETVLNDYIRENIAGKLRTQPDSN